MAEETKQTATAAATTILIHAYRRKVEDDKKPDASAFDNVIAGCRVKFKANDKGHIVGSVPVERKDVISRLVDEIPEAYVIYDGEEVAEEQAKILTPADTEPPKPQFVIVNSEGAQVDLKAMDDTALKQFIKDNHIKNVPGAAKGDKLRAAICIAVGQPQHDLGDTPSDEDLANQ